MSRVISIFNQKGGVGKCVSPETPVLLSSGEISSIKELFDGSASGKLAVKRLDEEGGEFIKPASPLKIFSLDEDLKFVEKRVEWLYRGRAEKLYEIESNKGKSIKVTPDHPFLVSSGGELRWKPAKEIREGDFVAAPREVSSRFSEQKRVNVYKLLPDSIFARPKERALVNKYLEEILEHSKVNLGDRILSLISKSGPVRAELLYAITNKPAVFAHLKKFLDKGIVSRKRVGNSFSYFLNRPEVVDYYYERGFSVAVWKKLGWSEDSIEKLTYYNRFSHPSKPINPAILNLDENLATFISIVIAEGCVGPSRIVLYNTSRNIINTFTSYCDSLDLICKEERVGNQRRIIVNQAGTLMKILQDIFEVPVRGNSKSFRVKLPNVVLRSPTSVLGAYLGTYIGCEGYVAKNRTILEITSASYENIVRLQYAFLRFGVNGKIKSMYKLASNSPSPKKRLYHSLVITGADYIRRLLDEKIILSEERKLKRLTGIAKLRFNTNVDVVPVVRLLREARKLAGLLQKEIGVQGTITDYEDGSVIPSRKALQKIVTKTAEKAKEIDKDGLDTLERLSKLAHSDIYWERVASIREFLHNDYVYDLTVADTHNFIAGNGAFVVHNTTTAMNLSAYLSMAGKRVLLIDFDPQFNATVGCGVRHEPDETIYHALMAGVAPEKVVKRTFLANFDVAPASADLAGGLVELVNLPDRENYLRNFVSRLRGHYDFVLIDLGPSLNLLTINGLMASDEVIVPIQCEYYSLEGLGQLLQTIDLVKDNLGHDIKVAGALLTMYDKREKLSREIAREVRHRFPYRVYEVEIPRSVSLAEAPSFQKPIVLYAPQSAGARAYEMLAREVIGEGGVPERPLSPLGRFPENNTFPQGES